MHSQGCAAPAVAHVSCILPTVTLVSGILVEQYGGRGRRDLRLERGIESDSHWSQIIGSSMLGRESIRVTEADPSNRTLLVSDLSMFIYDELSAPWNTKVPGRQIPTCPGTDLTDLRYTPLKIRAIKFISTSACLRHC